MPATLVHLSESVHVVQTKRHDSLSRSFWDARDTLQKLLVSAAILHPYSRHSATQALDEAWERMVRTHCALNSYLNSRVRDLEARLRRTLGSPLSEAQRGDVLTTLYGPRGPRRNPHVLSESEQKIIAQYRELDTAERQMIRTFLARFTSFKHAGGAR